MADLTAWTTESLENRERHLVMQLATVRTELDSRAIAADKGAYERGREDAAAGVLPEEAGRAYLAGFTEVREHDERLVREFS